MKKELDDIKFELDKLFVIVCEVFGIANLAYRLNKLIKKLIKKDCRDCDNKHDFCICEDQGDFKE